MKKHLLFILLSALLLSACSLPGVVQLPVTPTAPSLALAATAAPVATAMPQATAPLATATSVPAAQPAAPVTPVLISQFRMLDAQYGWGWNNDADGNATLLRTLDGGQTWQKIAVPQKSINPYAGFFLDSNTAWLPYFNSDTNTGGLLKTLDGGQTWVSLPSLQDAQNAIYTFTSPTEGLAETAGVGAGNLYLNLFNTSDGGQTWAPILLTAPSPEPGLAPGTVHLCNICGDTLHYDKSRTIIAYGELANEPTGAVRLAWSGDLGQTWQDLKLPFPDPKYKDGLVGPREMRFFGAQGVLPVNIIKYGSDGALEFSVLVIYTTQDGGKTWVAAPATLESKISQFDSVQILSPSDAFVRCGGNLCATHDGAQTWQTLPVTLNFDSAKGGPDYVSQFQFVSPTTGWAVSGENPNLVLWKTTDGGQTWTRLNPGLAQ